MTRRGRRTSDLTRSPACRSIRRAALAARALVAGVLADDALAAEALASWAAEPALADSRVFFAAATRLAAGPRFLALDDFFLPAGLDRPGALAGRVRPDGRAVVAGRTPESASSSSGDCSGRRRPVESGPRPGRA